MQPFFNKELENFRTNLVLMGELAMENVRRAIKSLIDKDPDLADEALAKDDQIDRLEVAIDQEAVRYISLRAPVATDLRLIAIGMKASHDIERIGDEASAIAKRAKKLALQMPVKNYLDIPQMTALVLEMLRDSIDSFIHGDEKKAHTIFERDKTVNALNLKITNELKESIMENPAIAYQGIELMFVSKSLERIGDHAKNIAEDVIYLLSGEDLRHSDKTKARSDPDKP